MNQHRKMAQQLQRFGRNGDTILAHINPQEAAMLKRMGGSGTRNPVTGAFEFFQLSREDRDDIAAMFGYQGPGGAAAPGSIKQYMQETGQTEAFQRAKADAAAQQAKLGVTRSGYSLTPSAYGIGEGSTFQPQTQTNNGIEGLRSSDPAQGSGQAFDYQGFLDSFFDRLGNMGQQQTIPSYGAGFGQGMGGTPYGYGYYPGAALGAPMGGYSPYNPYGAFPEYNAYTEFGPNPWNFGSGSGGGTSYQNDYTGFGDFYTRQNNPRGGFEPRGAFAF